MPELPEGYFWRIQNSYLSLCHVDKKKPIRSKYLPVVKYGFDGNVVGLADKEEEIRIAAEALKLYLLSKIDNYDEWNGDYR